MPNLQIPHLSAIRAGNAAPADLARALQSVQEAVNNMAQQTNAQPIGVTPAPTAPSALSVTGGAGYFRAHITDNSPSFRGKENFIEVSENENDWTTPHKIHLGASTSWYGQLGEKNLHFRAYSAHDTTNPTPAVYAMNVSGVGGEAPAIVGNAPGGTGYGTAPYTTPNIPKR